MINPYFPRKKPLSKIKEELRKKVLTIRMPKKKIISKEEKQKQSEIEKKRVRELYSVPAKTHPLDKEIIKFYKSLKIKSNTANMFNREFLEKFPKTNKRQIEVRTRKLVDSKILPSFKK
jgi:hypothetical protein